MTSFSFIHAADLHLDSPFSALVEENHELVHKMRSATFEAFDNIFRLCIDKKVDFLLIAGDVYDSADRSLRAQVKFRDGLKKLHDANILSFVVHGNHDPINGWSSTLDWPSSVHMFGSSIETVEAKRDEAVLCYIQGISFAKKEESRNLSRLFKRTSSAFHIGLLHANLGSNTGHEPYAPCSMEDLRKAEMDYWALGHVHNHKIYSEESPVIVYPGNSQGRSIRETDERGCYLVRVNDDKEVETEFIATDVIRWLTREIKIDDIQTEQDLLDTLEGTCLDISKNGDDRPSIVRITLVGNGPLFGYLTRPNTADDLLEIVHETGTTLSPSVWIDQIKTNTGPELDLEEIRKRQDFLGELLRISEDLSTDNEFETVIRKELSQFYDNPRIHRFIDFPDGERLRYMLEKAEKLCLQGLLGGDSE